MKTSTTPASPDRIAFAVLGVVLSLSLATATMAAAAGPSPEPAVIAAGESPEWEALYQRAHASVLTGRFAEAERDLASLVQSALLPESRGRVIALADLCRRWIAEDVRLSRPGDRRGLLSPAHDLPDRRTTDELAVLYTGSVLYGIGSGIVLATITEPTSAAGGILPALGFAAASAGIVAVLDHKLELRYGVPQSIISGMLIGLEEGLVWTLWNQARVTFDNEWGPTTVAAVLWSTATAGAVAGGITGTLAGTTPGRASLMGSGALWTGLVAGLTVGGLKDDASNADDYGMLAAAIGVTGGAVAGAVLGSQVSPSIARVRFVDLGGLAGGLLFGGLYLAAKDESSDSGGAMIAASLGVSTGLVTAWLLTRRMEPDAPRTRSGAVVPSPGLSLVLAPTTGSPGMVLVAGGAI